MIKRYPYTKIRGIYRPIVEVEFIHREGSNFIFEGLIDSGAFYSLFPGWIAKLIGHNVEKGRIFNFKIAGQKVNGYLHKAVYSIEGIIFERDIYFSNDIDDWEFGILGHEPFFKDFKIEFVYKEGYFVLKSL